MSAHEEAYLRFEEVARSQKLPKISIAILALSGLANLTWVALLCWLSYSNLFSFVVP